jgi:hypothetical protein
VTEVYQVMEVTEVYQVMEVTEVYQVMEGTEVYQVMEVNQVMEVTEVYQEMEVYQVMVLKAKAVNLRKRRTLHCTLPWCRPKFHQPSCICILLSWTHIHHSIRSKLLEILFQYLDHLLEMLFQYLDHLLDP